MYYERKAVTATVALWLVIVLFYYNIFNLMQPYSMKINTKIHNSPRWISRKAISHYNGTDFLIKTPGCIIPNYLKSLNFKEPPKSQSTCYERAVFVERVSESEVMFLIDHSKIIKKKGQHLKCTYRFARRSHIRGQEDTKLMFTEPKLYKNFVNGTKVKLEEEVISVLCDLLSPEKRKISTYDDAYLMLKKKPTDIMNKSLLKENVILMKESWNILIVGMDTMSRGRAYHSIPKTVKYLEENNWLDYRGYQKIAVNTFPNIMAVLSGMNASSAYHSCGSGMDKCEHLMLWNKFKEAGYMTAFGEDNLSLPDTFSPYKGFTSPPTDHYTRPFFLLGEYRNGNLVCTRAKPSAEHLLDYALQFIRAYKNDNFFGYFWINSYSHNLINLPTLLEDNLISFFKNMESTGIMANTFIFFLSDHGIRYGPMRVPRESYYEERLPMLFMWVPYEFRETHPGEYDNLQFNQYRLTTPYDLHATLLDIMLKTNNNVDTTSSEGCSQCTSLTNEISSERTCEDAHVEQKWCSCHSMAKSFANDSAANLSLDLVVKYVQNKSISVKTRSCTKCSHLEMTKLLRSDFYEIGNKTYYVIAVEFKPGNVAYEATVEKIGDEFKILHPTDTITQYNVRGDCVVNKYDRAYCVCIKDNKCIKNYDKKKRVSKD